MNTVNKRLNELTLISPTQIIHQRVDFHLIERTITSVICMWNNDDVFFNYITELIGNGIRFVSILTTKTNEITLEDTFSTREIVQTVDKNEKNILLMTEVLDDITFGITNLDLFLVEHGLGTNEELTILRMCTPHNLGSTINLHRDVRLTVECINDTQVTSEDEIFRMFQMCVYAIIIRVVSLQGHFGGY